MFQIKIIQTRIMFQIKIIFQIRIMFQIRIRFQIRKIFQIRKMFHNRIIKECSWNLIFVPETPLHVSLSVLIISYKLGKPIKEYEISRILCLILFCKLALLWNTFKSKSNQNKTKKHGLSADCPLQHTPVSPVWQMTCNLFYCDGSI